MNGISAGIKNTFYSHPPGTTIGRAALTLSLLMGVVGFSAPAQPKGQGAVPVEPIAIVGEGRTVVDFNSDWRFCLGDFAKATVPAFDDSGWRLLNVPHDWSVEGPFGPDNGSGNGFAPGGIGWYRKHFSVDGSVTNKVVKIEFDGIYDHSQVWINGHFVGGRPYGYSSFECELTPLLKVGGADNVIAVRVDHSRFADSRWYTGSGIYRNVRLRITEKLHIPLWGLFVTTPEVSDSQATVRIETLVQNSSGQNSEYTVVSELISPEGQAVAQVSTSGSIKEGATTTNHQAITFGSPQRWDLDTPQLYKVKSRVVSGSRTSDDTETAFGIRTLRFDPDKGFFLNEKPLKLKGVCIHHEAGCVGAAVPVKVLERRLKTLREIGVNAIRTSHNPPAPELLDLCDRLGLLVKDEAFDEFTPAKNKWVSGRNDGEPSRFGYAESFEEWSVRDVQDMVRRDRNHPSVIMWSIGNEIDYSNDPFTHPVLRGDYRPGNPPAKDLVRLGRPLIAAVKAMDKSRPVTAALANVEMSDAVGFGGELDIVGYNYQEQRYAADHRKYPNRFIFGSETSHDYRNWLVVRDNDYVAGQFLWTGIDYLGEANRWPNRGSAAGLLDLCGFKKPLAWFRQSLWSDKPMVYLSTAELGGADGRRGRFRAAESWNWGTNATVLVRCTSTCPEVQLFLNEESLGAKRLEQAVDGALEWRVPFKPGTLRAVGLVDGKARCEFQLQTAGPAAKLELRADAQKMAADGRDVAHVEFRVTDAQGVLVPNATNEVAFEISGPARILGLENGDLNDPPDYTAMKRKVLHGRGLAIVHSTKKPGEIIVSATAPGLPPATLKLSATSNQ